MLHCSAGLLGSAPVQGTETDCASNGERHANYRDHFRFVLTHTHRPFVRDTEETPLLRQQSLQFVRRRFQFAFRLPPLAVKPQPHKDRQSHHKRQQSPADCVKDGQFASNSSRFLDSANMCGTVHLIDSGVRRLNSASMLLQRDFHSSLSTRTATVA